MVKPLTLTLIAVAVSGSALVAVAQSQRASYTVLNLLVFGVDEPFDRTPYTAEIKAEIRRHVQRWNAYKSRRRRPSDSTESDMLYAVQIGYERRLVAAAKEPGAERLAAAYVDTLRPCYEWEGFHDCPEREAIFADQYHAANPAGPFSEFLPLLAAHRWLCAAEGYDYEQRPVDAARSRDASRRARAAARQSASALVRQAAHELETRGQCHVGR